jgi:hypothetical protein
VYSADPTRRHHSRSGDGAHVDLAITEDRGVLVGKCLRVAAPSSKIPDLIARPMNFPIPSTMAIDTIRRR